MTYTEVVQANFISRPNRFIAYVELGDKKITMNPGDSIYFNPMIPHGQHCSGDVKARFLTVIAE